MAWLHLHRDSFCSVVASCVKVYMNQWSWCTCYTNVTVCCCNVTTTSSSMTSATCRQLSSSFSNWRARLSFTRGKRTVVATTLIMHHACGVGLQFATRNTNECCKEQCYPVLIFPYWYSVSSLSHFFNIPVSSLSTSQRLNVSFENTCNQHDHTASWIFVMLNVAAPSAKCRMSLFVSALPPPLSCLKHVTSLSFLVEECMLW